MADAVNQAPWRDIRVTDITCWTPRVRNALVGYFDTLGELADATRLDLRRVPNVGQNAINEITDLINRAKVGETLTTPQEPREVAVNGAVAGVPHCGTCRWWGHDSAGPWVISPRAGPVNVCGVQRQNPGEPPRRNVITAAHDWCGEHLPSPSVEGAPSS